MDAGAPPGLAGVASSLFKEQWEAVVTVEFIIYNDDLGSCLVDRVCVHVCMCVHACVCLYVCMLVRGACMRTGMCVRVYACMNTYVCACVHARMCMCVHMCVRTAMQFGGAWLVISGHPRLLERGGACPLRPERRHSQDSQPPSRSLPRQPMRSELVLHPGGPLSGCRRSPSHTLGGRMAVAGRGAGKCRASAPCLHGC